jgi:hypothetical protein
VETAYDSTADTLRHIARVRDLLDAMAVALIERGRVHDASKLGPEEKPHFDRETPRLKSLTYGSDEYRESLKRLGEALRHHYAANSHHPEHYADGVAGMDLLDLVEMACDWKAASERAANADFGKGLEVSIERFGIEPQLAAILRNTAERLGWLNR